MKKIGFFKFLLIIFLANIVESFFAPYLIMAFISFPITFLAYSLTIYNSSKNINPFAPLMIGFFVDLISDTPFGLNALLFCLMSYTINSYSNTFKLFSYIQICIFFSASAVFYVGFKYLFINLENFSYLVLLVSFIFNTFLFMFIAMVKNYFPSMSINYYE